MVKIEVEDVGVYMQTRWFMERPDVIKGLFIRLPFMSTVEIISTKQKGYVLSWFEDGSVKLGIPKEESINGNGYIVYGYKEDDLILVDDNVGKCFELDDDLFGEEIWKT